MFWLSPIWLRLSTSKWYLMATPNKMLTAILVNMVPMSVHLTCWNPAHCTSCRENSNQLNWVYSSRIK